MAFRALFEVYYKKLCFYLSDILLNMETSKDIAQEIFINIWNNRENIPTGEDFEKYLFRAARNRAIDILRKQKVKDSYSKYIIDYSKLDYSPEADFEVKELENLLITAIESFPTKTKEIFYLKREKNKKISEIAQELSISKQSVSWHLSNIKLELKKVLKNYYSH